MITLISRIFQHIQKNFGKRFISGLFIKMTWGLLLTISFLFCNFLQDAKMQLSLSTNLGQGLDKALTLSIFFQAVSASALKSSSDSSSAFFLNFKIFADSDLS